VPYNPISKYKKTYQTWVTSCCDHFIGALKVPWDDANESVDIRYFPCEVEVQIVLFCNDGRIAGE
jgi:hypothetical protein